MDQAVLDRFEDKIAFEPMSGCWLWTAASTPLGYGRFSIDGGPELAHRVSFTLYRGPVGAAECVLHLCDTPACVNPDHLFLGDRADNNRDAARKGRNVSAPARLAHAARCLERPTCVHGHPWTEDNTYRPPGRSRRDCRQCRSDRAARFRSKDR